MNYPNEAGIWVLISPSGKRWEGRNSIHCAAQEIEERVPPKVRAERILKALEKAPRVILGTPCSKCGGTEYYCADCLDEDEVQP